MAALVMVLVVVDLHTVREAFDAEVELRTHRTLDMNLAAHSLNLVVYDR